MFKEGRKKSFTGTFNSEFPMVTKTPYLDAYGIWTKALVCLGPVQVNFPGQMVDNLGEKCGTKRLYLDFERIINYGQNINQTNLSVVSHSL